jgi:hypothetical protein
MRVWDLPTTFLCRQHLLGEHREIHAIYNIIKRGNSGGYSNHPEVKRWVGKLDALKKRHDMVVDEMTERGYNHHSPMRLVGDDDEQKVLIDSMSEQIDWIKSKGCDCNCQAWYELLGEDHGIVQITI